MFSFCELWVLRLLGTKNFSCKIVKNRILSEVCKLTVKQHRLIVYFLAQIWCIKSIDAWLAYTSPDLLARFWNKVNLSKKNWAWFFYFGLPFRQRNETFKVLILIQCVNCHYDSWLIEDDCYRLGVNIRLLTRCQICFTLGLFANYFALKSFSLSLKSHMNVFDLNYK